MTVQELGKRYNGEYSHEQLLSMILYYLHPDEVDYVTQLIDEVYDIEFTEGNLPPMQFQPTHGYQ